MSGATSSKPEEKRSTRSGRLPQRYRPVGSAASGFIRRFRLKPESVLELRRRFSLPEVDELFSKKRELTRKPSAWSKLRCPRRSTTCSPAPDRCANVSCTRRHGSDNNLAENALRPIKLGAKNWLFIGPPQRRAPSGQDVHARRELPGCSASIPKNTLSTCSPRVDDHPASRIDELTPPPLDQVKERLSPLKLTPSISDRHLVRQIWGRGKKPKNTYR